MWLSEWRNMTSLQGSVDMTKSCWIILLINALKDKFSSFFKIKKHRDSGNTTLERESFHLWLGKDINEKVNHTLRQIKISLRTENCQQKKTVRQVAHYIRVVSLAGSEHILNNKKICGCVLWITLDSASRGKKPRLTDVHFQPHTVPYGRDIQTEPRDRQKVCLIPKTLKYYEWMLQQKSGKSSLQFLLLGKLCISHSILSADKPVVVDQQSMQRSPTGAVNLAQHTS